jgi:hypothetical protein
MVENACYAFGYGSLVDRVNQVPGCIWPVKLTGFTRAWRHCIDTDWGKVCALTIIPNNSARVTGVLVPLSPEGLTELDKREIGYIRRNVQQHHLTVEVSANELGPVFTYFSEEQLLRPGSREYPIWCSYVDYILAYYIQLFGGDAAHRFITETVGWEAPMLDDRHYPKYPRAKPLSIQMRTMIDQSLAAAGIQNA